MSTRFACYAACLLTLSSLATPARATSANEIRQQAEDAYRRAIAVQDPARARQEFRTAAERYEELIAAGHANGRLYINLGSAYLGAGDVGRAVLNYRRAEQVCPGDDRLRSGLDQALQRVEGVSAPRLSWWLRATGATHLGVAARAWAGGGLYLTGWLLLVGWRWFGNRALALGGGLTLLVGLASLGSAGGQLAYDAVRPAGVVCAEGVILRQGNGPSFPACREQPLPPGCEFRVLQQTGGWQRVLLGDGTAGWIPEQPRV
jgi:hypothetical protein